MNMMKNLFHFLLWLFRVFGLMPNSNTRWITGVSKFFSGFHVIINILLIALEFYFAEEHFEKFSRQFYVYVGFGLYGLSCFTYIVNIIESLVYGKEQHQLFDLLFTMANESPKRYSEKLFKLKLKCVLVPVLAVMIGVWIDGLFKIFGLEAVTFVYFNCFMLLRSVQMHMLADGIRIHLEIINEDLTDLLETEKEKIAIDFKSLRTRMEKIRSDYLRLKDFSIIINDSNTWSMLCLALLYASFLICISYWFLISLFKDIVMLEAYQSMCYIGVLILVLAISTDPCTQCIGLSSQIGYNIHKIQQLGEDPATVNQLASQITSNPIFFTAAGYFQVNYGLLASMLAATVTYLMILISFDKDQGQKFIKITNESLLNNNN